MYKSLSSMFFYILCIHLCSTEELGAVPLSTRSTRWLILVQPQLSSYLFFLSNAFSDCGQNGFYLQAELFLFAIRKNSACSQKNFWLHRTESEAVNIKQEEQQEYQYEVLQDIRSCLDFIADLFENKLFGLFEILFGIFPLSILARIVPTSACKLAYNALRVQPILIRNKQTTICCAPRE